MSLVPNNPFPVGTSGNIVTYGTDDQGVPLWLASSSHGMASSRDAITWSIIPNAPTINLLKFGKNSAGDPLWIAYNYLAHNIYISLDGNSWESHTYYFGVITSIDISLYKLAFGYDNLGNPLWNAITRSINTNTNEITYSLATSVDGITWNTNTSPPFTGNLATMQSIAYGNNMWLLQGNTVSGGMQFAKSTNGTSWNIIQSNTATAGDAIGLLYVNNEWFVGNYLLSTSFSSNEEEWVAYNINGFPGVTISEFAYGGGKWVAVGRNSVSNSTVSIWASDDGKIWNELTGPLGNPFTGNYAQAFSVAYGGGKWVVVGYSSQYSLATSSDGTNWYYSLATAAPNQAPSTPTGTATDDSITLSFDVAGITGNPTPSYSIKYYNGAEITVPATLLSGTTYTATVTGLMMGTTYSFTAVASNSAGAMNSEPLFISTTGTLPCPPDRPPSTPTGTATDDTVTLTFDVADIIANPVPSYIIYYNDHTGTQVQVTPTLDNGTIYTATITGLIGGTSYSFAAMASNILGTLASAAFTISTTGVSPVPNQAPTVPDTTSISDTSVTLTFDVAGITGTPAPTFSIKYSDFLGDYDIPASLVSGTIYTATATSLIPGTSYEFRSSASNTYGTVGSEGRIVSTTGVSPAPNQAPTAPIITSITETSVTVTFDVAGITGDPTPTFNIIYTGGSKGDGGVVSLLRASSYQQFVEATLQSGTTWTATLTGLSSGIVYTLFSQAINTYGVQNSAEVTIRIPSAVTLNAIATVTAFLPITEYGLSAGRPGQPDNYMIGILTSTFTSMTPGITALQIRDAFLAGEMPTMTTTVFPSSVSLGGTLIPVAPGLSCIPTNTDMTQYSGYSGFPGTIPAVNAGTQQGTMFTLTLIFGTAYIPLNAVITIDVFYPISSVGLSVSNPTYPDTSILGGIASTLTLPSNVTMMDFNMALQNGQRPRLSGSGITGIINYVSEISSPQDLIYFATDTDLTALSYTGTPTVIPGTLVSAQVFTLTMTFGSPGVYTVNATATVEAFLPISAYGLTGNGNLPDDNTIGLLTDTLTVLTPGVTITQIREAIQDGQTPAIAASIFGSVNVAAFNTIIPVAQGLSYLATDKNLILFPYTGDLVTVPAALGSNGHVPSQQVPKFLLTLIFISGDGGSTAPNTAPVPVLSSTSTSVSVTVDATGVTGTPTPTYSVSYRIGSGTATVVPLTLQNGLWRASVTGLTGSTTYIFTSQATNSAGTVTSAPVSVTTAVPLPPIAPWNQNIAYAVGSIVTLDGIAYICVTAAPATIGPYGGFLDGTQPDHLGITYWRLAPTYPTTTGPNPTATPSVATAQTISYKKIVCWGLNPNVVNFATAGTLGHRVCVSIPVDIMNAIFVWSRASGELAPTGRLANVHANGSSPLQDALVTAMQGGFNDMDGVSAGLNFSSTATDMAGDLKRDPSIYNAASRVTDGVSTTHYGANDLVMAYLMFKCFGSSSYDPTTVIYNIDDAFNMLSSEELADAITASLEAEDALANACVLPNGKGVNAQLPGDNKGLVDAMFRAFLAADPLRYFLNGVQIPGLFETNFVSGTSDPSVGGNWCLTVGDKLEIPLQLVFRAEVNVLSVQDNVQNPSSNTPDSANTNFIKGDANYTSGKADKANIIPIRLQLVCSAPVGATTGGTSGVQLPLQIAASAPVIFYTPANYGVQNALAAAAAGGVSPYTYSFGVTPLDLPSLAQGLTINSATGLVTFSAAVATTSVAYDAALAASNAATAAATAAPEDPTKAAAATTAAAAKVSALEAMDKVGGASGVLAVKSGKYSVPIIITDSSDPVGTVTVNVNMSFDDGAGSSNNANLAPVGSGGGSGTTFTLTSSSGTIRDNVTPGVSYTFINNHTVPAMIQFLDSVVPNSANPVGQPEFLTANNTISLTAPVGSVSFMFVER
jgi:hypothetical protein